LDIPKAKAGSSTNQAQCLAAAGKRNVFMVVKFDTANVKQTLHIDKYILHFVQFVLHFLGK
jgi:hypothetical protein